MLLLLKREISLGNETVLSQAVHENLAIFIPGIYEYFHVATSIVIKCNLKKV